MLLLEDKMMKIANIIDKEIYYDDAVVALDCDDWCPATDTFYYHRGLSCHAGMTKFVVVDESSSKVVKVPLWGGYYDVWDDETEEYTDDREYVEYEYANDREPADDHSARWNYIENEIRKYEEIEEDGFAEFFPKVEFYKMSKNGLPIYLQDRVLPFKVDYEKVRNSKSYKIAEEISQTINKKRRYARVNEYFISACVDFYGKEKTQRFIEYITLDKPELGRDLHSNNIGFTIDGHPIILDWAGFREDI